MRDLEDRTIIMVKVSQLELHPQADEVDRPSSEEREWLKNDINDRGLTTPLDVILLKNGKYRILDGQTRFEIAEELLAEDSECELFPYGTIPCVVVDLHGEDEVDYMVKAAVNRRHLTKEQRGRLALRWMKGQEAVTTEILKESGKKGGRGKKGLAFSPNPFNKRKEAAKKYGTTDHYVRKAQEEEQETPVLVKTTSDSGKPRNPNRKGITVYFKDKLYSRLVNVVGSEKKADINEWTKSLIVQAVKKAESNN